MNPADWIAVAQVCGAIAMLLVLKPIADLKRDISNLRTMLYEDFVTYERLNEKFQDRDQARSIEDRNSAKQNEIRQARASRRKNVARKSPQKA